MVLGYRSDPKTLFRRLFLPLAFVVSGVFVAHAAGVVIFEIHDATTWSGYWGRGSVTNIEVFAERYVPAENQRVCSVGHRITRSGTPTDQVALTIFQGGSEPGVGVALTTVYVPGASVPTSPSGYTEFVLDSCLDLAAGTPYWFQWSRTGPNPSAVYQSAFRASDEYPNASYWQYQSYAYYPMGWVEYPNREWSFRLTGPAETKPAVQNFDQLGADGVTVIPENGTTTKGTVVFQAMVASPLGKKVKLEVDIGQDGFLLGVADASSALVDSGTMVSTTISRLRDGAYSWQARAVDEDGDASDWAPFGDPAKPDFNIRREPVIIVPGIMGSKISQISDSKEIWPNIASMRRSVSDDYLDVLALSSSGQQYSDQLMYASDVIREEFAFTPLPILRNTYLRTVIDDFVDTGYEENKNIYILPFDWRLDLGEEYARLSPRIANIAQGSPSGKVNIIAHSMGGLLMRRFVADGSNADLIGKIVLVAVPKLGAPKAFKVLMYGDDMGMNKLGIGLNSSKVKEITQNRRCSMRQAPKALLFSVTATGERMSDQTVFS